MRYMLDTNIVLFMTSNPTRLSNDVLTILEDYDNTFCISVETVRELIVNYNNGDIASKTWHNADEMIDAIKHQYFIDILSQRRTHAYLCPSENKHISQAQRPIGPRHYQPRHYESYASDFQR